MSSFYSIELYNPLLVLLIGLVTFSGFLGFGLAILKLIRITLESPWRQVVAILLGILSTSLLVQAVAMGGIATKTVLAGLWMIIVLTGLFILVREGFRMKRINFPMPHGWALLPFLLLLTALVTNLIASMAPSSKLDELYYHMVLPSRIVNDGALRFYMIPWEGAILPQMLFQIALTPLHAMGYPDAGNILSWGLSLMLVWFGWRLISREHPLSGWGFIVLACLVTGMYPIIWEVTNGSYAMGDLATAAAVVALLSHKELIEKTGVKKYAFLTSFLVLSSCSSRVTLLPLGIAILLLMFFFVFRNKTARNSPGWMVLLYTFVPWVILYLPMLTWTFLKSGSPYGPVFPGFLEAGSVYNPETIRSMQHMDRLLNMPSLYTIIENTLIYFPVVVWLSIILVQADKRIPQPVRLTGLFLFILQTVVICVFIFFDPRHYGGLPQGILIFWMISKERSGWKQVGWLNKRVVTGSLVFLVPWLTLQIFYASQFFPVAMGFQDKMEFYHQKIAFMKDYLALDKILPKDAVLIIRGGNGVRMNLNFSPRPVYLGMDEPPSGRRCYIFSVGEDKPVTVPACKIDPVIYQNDKAVTLTFRNPFRPPVTGKLSVYATESVTNPLIIR